MTDIQSIQSRVSRIIEQQQPRPRQDAIAERARATFNVQALATYVNDGADNITKRQRLARELEKLPWSNKSQRYFLSREEEYVGGLRAATQIWARMASGEYTVDDALLVRTMVDWPGGLELHIGMFIPTIVGQGTEEQKAELLPKCNSLEIIGTYAQTELGHGTFVRGLETTATFDKGTQQFIIHSPTQTATKWWPGGLAKTATHAVVMARLFSNGRDFGPHAFVVPLRSLQTHRSLPGVTLGDIGPKFGYNGVDNGFLRFDHVAVPRSAMLSKFAQVKPDGTYCPPPKDNQKAMYSTMLFVRADIVANAARYLAKSATIATRYCCVRRQTAAAPGEPELQVMDYENTAATLLPIVAASFVLQAMGRTLWAAYKDYERLRAQGRFDTLPELHALSSGLKAVVTTLAADGMEACRRTCGGHGYSQLSGLPTLFASYVQNCTWEGDNNVLLLQTARYVIKAAVAAKQDAQAPLPDGLAYLRARTGSVATSEAGWQLGAFERRAAWLASTAIQELMQHPQAGGKLVFEGTPWNSCATTLIALGRAHCHVALLRNFGATLASAAAAGTLRGAELAVLQAAGDLWATDLMFTSLGEFMLSGALSQSQAQSVPPLRRKLLAKIRPDAISLVDAWAFTDYELNSALGREDGDVYKALLDMAQNSPLNRSDEGPAWRTVLQPAIADLQQARSKL